MPHLQDFATNLQGCHYFSKVDLVHDYHQVPVQPEDIHKTAVITPFRCGNSRGCLSVLTMLLSHCKGLFMDSILQA